MSAVPPTSPDEPRDNRRPAIWTLHLWGLADPRLDLAVTLATVAVLAWTRFALLASGPWEWDETLFARGILRFDINAHFPHPPGFPLWLALGWLIQPFVSEPLRGLQILSAAASVATLWPLAALARRAAPPLVATGTTLVFLMLPGVWMHAPRGFSETPSAFLALWAAAVLVDRLTGKRAVLFTLLVTASFLVRPIILPSLGLLWIAGALTVRPRSRLLPGVAIGAGAIVVAMATMIVIQGRWDRFWEAFGSHAGRHARGLVENVVVGFSGTGIIKGTGGAWPSLTLLVLAILGLIVWSRLRGRRFAAVWAAVWLVGVAQLVWLQDRKYPRYAVPFQLAAAPLAAAGTAAVAPPATAAGALAVLGAFLAVRAYPIVAEQHSNLMSIWAALRFAAETANREGYDLVLEPGLAPFLSYQQELDKRRGRPWTTQIYGAPTPTIQKALPSGRFLLVTDRPERYLPPIGRTWRFTLQSQELTPLSQGRFQRAIVLENAILPITGWQVVQRDERKTSFVWGGTQAKLLLPPLPAGTSVGLEVEPTRGPAALELQVNGATTSVMAGRLGRTMLWLPPEALVAGRSNELAFSRPEAYPPRSGGRPYALRVSGMKMTGATNPWRGALATVRERAQIPADLETVGGSEAAPVTLAGTYAPERFPGGRGTWTEPLARLTAPAAAGVLSLTVWAPRPTPPQLEVWVDGEQLAGPLVLPAAPVTVRLLLAEPETEHEMTVELRSVPYLPERPGPRPLGVVIGGVSFDPILGRRGETWRGELDEAARGWRFLQARPGVWDEERFAGVRGAWTKPHVRLRLPAGPGTLALTTWAPRPSDPRFEVWMGDRVLFGPIDPGNAPTTISIPLPPDTPLDRLVELELRAQPFVPARASGGRDTRSLGVVVSDIAFTPAALSPAGGPAAPR